MAKLRHVALSVPDPHQAAEFYIKAFDMKKVGQNDSAQFEGVYLSDGVINLALLHFKTDELTGEEGGKDFVGLHHIGFWVDDAHKAQKQVESAGAAYLMGEIPEQEQSFYEVKFRDPNGVMFDISAHGWGGAVKNPGAG